MGQYSQAFHDLFAMVQEGQEAPSEILGLKLQEEVGEFSEVLMYELGYLQHKDKEFESLFGEAADIINVVVGILAKQNPNKHPRELTLLLLESIIKKGGKYAKIMEMDDKYFTEG